MDGEIAAVAEQQHALFTRRQARAIGLSRAALAARIHDGTFEEIAPGVLRVAGAPPSWRQSLRAATLVGSGSAVASHRAAAVLHGLDGFQAGPIEVSVTASCRLSLANTVVHHVQSLEPPDVTTIDGIPVTGLARTLCDLGSVVGADLVERALDDARRRFASLRWLRETALRLHRPGQSGTKRLLVLLDALDGQGSVRGSWFEKLVEECLRSPKLPPLVRQHRVYDRRGRLAGILDAAFPAIRLGVEAHSRQFHFGRAAEHRDEDRDHRLSRIGWHVLYVGWQSTKHPSDLLELVIDTARHRPTLLAAPEP
jgi:predicted transcriptional regulator of viral defense system